MNTAMDSRPLLLVFVVTTVSVAILTRPGSAWLEPEPMKPEEDPSLLPPPSSQPLLSWPKPPRPPLYILGLRLLSGAECWTGLKGIKGCIWQIYDFLFTGSPNQIGKECCYAFEAIREDCWPKMFPLQPSYGPSIKTQCDMIIGNML